MIDSYPGSHKVNPQSEIDDEEFSRLDRMADVRGYSYDDARREQDPRSHLHPRPAIQATERPHYSRRGGRAYPELSDSELDSEWNVRREPLSDQQKETNRRGVMLVRKIGELIAQDEYKALDADTQEAVREALIARFNAE